ncbi:TetR/AcrR family transcriptional regulator [Tabrizicola sp.]|uniref:TetR/AcrR family transcriptional regulator n=1 Tax=Tabrizicola sp. TaxID=2005166 RepID=UPI002734A3C1|nr:TetR/AcrR family transcriptional regulator [Tabrizicola sp.]MDP3194710.1 TetR/AcrR family transcriptional regulator [Tabrizicola sp.]
MTENVTGADRELHAALNLFWASGAETTSYPEIVAATGLSRKALYARWPDKQALVEATLEGYRRTVLAGMLETLTREGPAAFWDRLEEATRVPGWNGCYLMRTGSGPLRTEPAVAAALAEYLDALHEAFRRRLREASLPVPPDLAAKQCVALLALISQRGAAEGAGPAVADLVSAGRRTCGMSQAAGTGGVADRDAG